METTNNFNRINKIKAIANAEKPTVFIKIELRSIPAFTAIPILKHNEKFINILIPRMTLKFGVVGNNEGIIIIP